MTSSSAAVSLMAVLPSRPVPPGDLVARRAYDEGELAAAGPRAASAMRELLALLARPSTARDVATQTKQTLRAVRTLWESAARAAEHP